MIKRFSMHVVLILSLILSTGLSAFAQKDKIEGLWYNEEKTAKVEIYKATDGKFWGKIVWLKEPLRNGVPKMDDKNPKDALKKVPLLGIVLLKHFKIDDKETYNDGEIYDPKNGKTYSCKITYKGDKLDVRGYVGISLIGRTTVWERTN
ncbi:DUF2147 domain-containing protein [Flavipsychrobacter stenotrophus]|nr:DUF2147 domain-containing protein [Flavipsychrobacter stenotrophus]